MAYASSQRTLLWGIPASHWHFEATDDTTILVDGMRSPKSSSYLHVEYIGFLLHEAMLFIAALVSLIGQRVQSRIPAGYYESQALGMWILRKRYQKSMRVFASYSVLFGALFFPIRRTNNCRKVVALWDGLNLGILTVEEAVASVPIETPVKYRRNDFPVISMRIDENR